MHGAKSHAATPCDADPEKPLHGEAVLKIKATDVDLPRWSSWITVRITRGTELANDLARDQTSDSFHAAYECLLGSRSDEKVSIDIDAASVILTSRDSGTISSWGYGFDSPPQPWVMNGQAQHFLVTLRASEESDRPSQILWDRVAVTTDSFSLARPAPLPKKQSGTRKLVWEGVNPQRAVSFAFTPDSKRQMQFTLETGGNGQYVPLDVERLILFAFMLVLLRRQAGTYGESLKPLHRATMRLTLVAGSAALLEVLFDIASQFTFYAYRFSSASYAAILIVAALSVVRPRRSGMKTRGVDLVIGVVVAGALVGALTGSVIGTPVFEVALVLPLVILFLDCLGAAMRATGGSRSATRALGIVSTAALILWCVAVVLEDAGVVFEVMLPLISSFVPLSVIWLVASRGRPIPLFPERGDRLLLALALSAVLVSTAPVWYLGLYLSVAGLVAFLCAVFVFERGARRSYIGRSGTALSGVPPEDLGILKQRLIEAEQKLNQAALDLKSLDRNPLTSEQVILRDGLERYSERLRCWPDDLSASMNASLGQSGLKSALLPGRSEPIEMALAIGPENDPRKHVSAGLRFALIMTALPAVYFAGNSAISAAPLIWKPYELTWSTVLFVENLISELGFWLVPAAVLAAVWGSLQGQRGSGRALQVWACVSLPVAVHWLIVTVLDLHSVTLVILRATVLLLVLLTFGLGMDLATLRSQRLRESGLGLIARYYRFGRAVAVITVVVPLLTAGISLWNQVKGGVERQGVTQTPGRQNTPSPAPTQPPATKQ